MIPHFMDPAVDVMLMKACEGRLLYKGFEGYKTQINKNLMKPNLGIATLHLNKYPRLDFLAFL